MTIASADLIVAGGTVYDGSGSEPFIADIAVAGDAITAIGDLVGVNAGSRIDATGMAVAPGFINMLSHSHLYILFDGRSMSELLQGVTTQISTRPSGSASRPPTRRSTTPSIGTRWPATCSTSSVAV